MRCLPFVPLDGIVHFNGFANHINKLANNKVDLLFRVTSVAHACLTLIQALATQSARAVVRLVTGNPLEATREVVGMLVQIVALPLLGLGRMLLSAGRAAPIEASLMNSHRRVDLVTSERDFVERLTLQMYGLLTFPVVLIKETTTLASQILTLDSTKMKKILKLVPNTVAALVDSLASVTLVKAPQVNELQKLFCSPYCPRS